MLQYIYLINNYKIMENKYKIKIGATCEYMNSENVSTSTAKLISSLEWKKIFIHEVYQDENEVEISQYEKTQKFIIPAKLLEEYFEEEKIENEVIEQKEKISFKFKKEYLLILGWIIIWIICFSFLQNVYWNAKIEKDLNMLEVYTERLIILENQKDSELSKQKDLRNQIELSIQEVQKIDKLKEEINNKKIELAQ